MSEMLRNVLESNGLTQAEAMLHDTHDLRRAGACFWAAMGLELHLIKRKGRWSSDSIFVYLESFILVGAAKVAAARTFSQKMPDKNWFVEEEMIHEMNDMNDCRQKLRPPQKEDARPLITAMVAVLEVSAPKGTSKQATKALIASPTVLEPAAEVWGVGDKLRYFSTLSSKNSSLTTGIAAEVIGIEGEYLQVREENGYTSLVLALLCLKEQLTRRRFKKVRD